MNSESITSDNHVRLAIAKSARYRRTVIPHKKNQHMALNDDIIQKINIDFGERANEATNMLTDAITKFDCLKTDRVIRCIIYLAKGNLGDLNKYIESANVDTRDVIFWAEYTGIEETKIPKRVRDFNKTFDKSAKNIKE